MVYVFLPLGLTILDPLDPVFFLLGRRRPAWSLPPCTVFVASSRLQRCAASENPLQRSSQQHLRISENMNLWMILNAGMVEIKCFEKKKYGLANQLVGTLSGSKPCTHIWDVWNICGCYLRITDKPTNPILEDSGHSYRMILEEIGDDIHQKFEEIRWRSLEKTPKIWKRWWIIKMDQNGGLR